MPVFNAYHYDPLCAVDEIRLLVLSPAKKRTTPLSGSIIHRRRSTLNGGYSAVSYFWGKQRFTDTLEVVDDSDTSYLRITATVDTFLRHLRLTRGCRYLWIDAICLNQEDMTEKAHQIPQMGHIYKEANDVRIWLGVEDHMTTTVYAFFREVVRGPEVEQGDMAGRLVGLMKDFFHDGSPTTADDHFRPGCYLGIRHAFGFFERSWFSRRWVIQEALLARNAIMHCGYHQLRASAVTSAAKRLQCLDLSDYPTKMAATLGTPRNGSSLLEDLWNFHQSGCRDEKDRIIALAGLHLDDELALDYSDDWKEIYHRAASFFLRKENNDTRMQVLLHLFEFGTISNREGEESPSWVPDWSKTRTRRLPLYPTCMNVDGYEKYPFSLDVSDKSALDLSGNVLQIKPCSSKGRARVWQVAYTMPLSIRRYDADQVIEMLQRHFPLSAAESPARILSFSSLIQTIVDFRNMKRRDPSAAFQRYIEGFLDKLPSQIGVDHFISLRFLGALLQDFCLFDLRPYCRPTSPGTGCGLGIGPKEIQVTDFVIPLWQREEKASRRPAFYDGRTVTVNVTTVLVVRKDKDDLPLATPKSRQVDEVVAGKRRGRIVGPALCLEFPDSAEVERNQMTGRVLADSEMCFSIC